MVETSDMNDQELIQTFADQHSDAAFAELVNRHIGFVYASALRQVQKPDLAADVAQAVFLLLARKASGLRHEVVLSGWLFRTTRFVATRAVRAEQRRQRREQEAAVMNLHNQISNPEETLRHNIGPHLDDAMAALPETDRRAVLLRFFENKRMREVGERIGLGEDAAKKRVTRAVDKLRAFLAGRGVTLSSVALGTLLFEFQSHAAPAGLATVICAAVGTSATATSATVAGLVIGGLRDWLWLKTRTLLPWVAAVAVLVTGTTVLVFERASQGKTVVALVAPADGNLDGSSGATDLPTTRPDVALTSEVERHLILSVFDRVENRPITGAHVLAQVWGAGKVDRSSESTTGADGACVLTVPQPPFSTFRVWLSAPGYVPLMMDWQAHEFSKSDVFHVTRLTRGTVLNGEVRDADGHPVADAKIKFGGPGIDMTQRENIAFHRRFSTCTTDATGRFQSYQIPSEWTGGGGIAVGVAHPAFAEETFWLSDPKQLATNHLVILTAGVALRGQVVGPRGDPVSGAGLQEDEKMFGLETKTDLDGRFEFPHVKPANYTLTIRAEGYAQLKQTLLAETNGPEVTLQLETEPPGEPLKPNRLQLFGTIVDAEHNEPVLRFRVLLNERRGGANRLLGEGVNGAFDWATEIGFAREFSLIIEADGYAPQESSVRQIGEPEPKFEFRLERATALTGVVLQPDGQPAVNASLGLAADWKYGMGLTEDGKLVNYGPPLNSTTTDELGRFSLRTMVDAERLLVAHASGCAAIPVASVTNIFITLQSWGQIEGLVIVGTNPAANQNVNVGHVAVPAQSGLLGTYYNTTTDAGGRFHFSKVQPGSHRVQRLIKFYKGETGAIGFSHGQTVTVRAGQTTSVVLGGKGAAVIGRLELSTPVNNYDWTLDPQALVQQRPDLPEVRPEDFHNKDQAFSRALLLRDSQITKYYLRIEPDGRFRIDDVLPGNYTLEVKIKAPPLEPMASDAWMYPRREIGRVDLLVVVSEADAREPLNLQTIIIPITNAAPTAVTTKK